MNWLKRLWYSSRFHSCKFRYVMCTVVRDELPKLDVILNKTGNASPMGRFVYNAIHSDHMCNDYWRCRCGKRSYLRGCNTIAEDLPAARLLR